MPHDTLRTRLADPDPWQAVAQARTQRGRVVAASCAAILARLRRSDAPRAAVAWAVARLGVALFLLAAAARVGRAGLLTYMIGQ